MVDFTVNSTIDGDTFDVKGGWVWKTEDGKEFSGTVIRPTGYNTPEKGEDGHLDAWLKLFILIRGKTVQLTNPVNVSYGRLVCDVYYNGKNLADYFPEYKV